MSAQIKGLLLFVLICTITMLLLYSVPADYWTPQRPATCLLSHCFCEAVDNHPLRQPVNSWSSLAYVLPGAIILFYKPDAEKRLAVRYAILMGLASIIIGVGSTFFHASLTFIGQFVDVFGMNMMVSFLFVYALKRLFNWSHARFFLFYLLLMLALTAALIWLPGPRRWLFGVVLMLGLIVEYRYLYSKRPDVFRSWLYLGSMTFGLAFFIFLLDNTHVLCFPEHLIQGHAFWHLLGALSVWYLYRYVESEKVISES